MWMFYSRSTNRRINHLHERVLRLIHDDYELTFEELLEKDELFTIHHYNIQTLCIELYKVYHNLWKPSNCPCRICKNYIPNVGFLVIFE